MLQFLSILNSRDRAPSNVTERQALLSDPLSHPALKAMTPQQLADIPFPRPGPRRRAESRCGARP